MKNIELKDFLNYKFLSNINTNTSGDACVFTLSKCNEEKNNYSNDIYAIKNGKCIQLTSSKKDTSPCFLDENTVLFKSTRCEKVVEKVKNGEEWTSFYTISLDGGEAVKYFDIPLFVSKIEPLSKDTFLLLANYDHDFSIYGREEKKEELLKAKKEEKDYEIFTKIPFCHNGGGYATNSITRLYVYNRISDTLEVVSPENVNVNNFELNKDKSEVVVTTNKESKRVSMYSGISTYHLESKKWEEVLEEKEYSISSAFYFNEGIIFVGNKEFKHGFNENERFFFIDKDHKVSLFYDNEISLWSSVGSDCRYGGGRQMCVYNDVFYYGVTYEKDGMVMSIDKDKNVKTVLSFDGSVDGYAIANDKIYYVAMKDGALQEVYVNDKKLTSFNTEVLKDKYVAKYEEVHFENDGIDFTGWVLLPKDYDPSKKYPAILDIHGGPKTVYGTVFYHEMQLWANMGYFVFFTNPRGSDGRGNEFMDIFGKYGTIDFDDLMKFTDTVLETYPAIDTTRVGVTGGSYGGFMTNWIIGHTDRFACAATQRSISNWISFYGTSDIGMFFAEDQIHGNVFDTPEKLWEHSPLKYAKNIKTPTLFIHSDEDYRCPLEQGLQLYTAMVDRGIEARFALFHGENHELSRSGLPKHRVRRLEEITNWMETYLK